MSHVLFHSILRCLSTILDISTIVHEEIRELEMKLSSTLKKLIIFGCSQLQILKIPQSTGGPIYILIPKNVTIAFARKS